MFRSKVFGHMRDYLEHHRPFYMDLLRQMVAINSFTTNPAGVNALGGLTAATFAELGFVADEIPSVNPAYGKHLVLTRQGRSKRKIGFVSHLDTVFSAEEEARNNFCWRQDGDRIYGPGTVDIKGGTVVIYMGLAVLREVVPDVYNDVTWVVLLNASEEALSEDFGELCLRRLEGRTSACLVFEGGHREDDVYYAVVARKGLAIYKVVVEGRAAHAGSAHTKGANAIVQMADTVQRIAALTDYERELTFNVGTVSGGTVVNRVPHRAEAAVEMRAFSPWVFEEGLNRMLALNGQSVVRSAEDDYPCQVDIDVVRRVPPWPRNDASDHLLAVWREAADSLGVQVLAEERGGLSDGNLTWQHLPTIDGLGPMGGNAHCSEQSADGSKEQEYAVASSFVPKAILNATAIMRLVEQETLAKV